MAENVRTNGNLSTSSRGVLVIEIMAWHRRTCFGAPHISVGCFCAREKFWVPENVKTNLEFKHKQSRGVFDRNHDAAPAQMLWGATYCLVNAAGRIRQTECQFEFSL